MSQLLVRVARRAILACLLLGCTSSTLRADDGYELWLRYGAVGDPGRRAEYLASISQLVVEGESATLMAVRDELARGLGGLLGRPLTLDSRPLRAGAVVAGTRASSPLIASLPLAAALRGVGREGFLIRRMRVRGTMAIVIAANSDVGVLYGAFALLREIQTHRSLRRIEIASAPRVPLRMLEHWDNLDRTVERGYAGASIWEWNQLPAVVSPRYRDYARANASLGINGAVLTAPNTNARALAPEFLRKAATLAAIFRPYGIRVYLTARFSAPIEIGGLRTADPLDPVVRQWWRHKADEVYAAIPDFGGKWRVRPDRFIALRHHIGVPGKTQVRGRVADAGEEIVHVRRVLVLKDQPLAVKTSVSQPVLDGGERPRFQRRDRRAAHQFLQ